MAPAEDLRETANSYFGLLSHASHSEKDRASLARAVLKRGHAVNGQKTKTYQKARSDLPIELGATKLQGRGC